MGFKNVSWKKKIEMCSFSLNIFSKERNKLFEHVTRNEFWVSYTNKVESKQQSLQWQHSSSKTTKRNKHVFPQKP